jgi:hypothetical protein
VAGRSTQSLAGPKMRGVVIVALAIIAYGSVLAEAANGDRRISNTEAKRIVRKAFARVCGGDWEFRCPYALEDRPTCPFEAIVLLPLGENLTYDGRNQPAWISLSERGKILRISYDRASVCPIA